MTEAKRDNNGITGILATSNFDGKSVLPLKVDSTDKSLQVTDGSTGSSFSRNDAFRDSNRIQAMIAVSSDDGITPVLVYIDSATSKLLVKSN